MGYVGKAQAVGDLGYGPVCLLEQYLSLLCYPAANQSGSGVAGRFFQDPVEVVDMHGQLIGVV